MEGGRLMEVLYPDCAGLDVHKKTVVACVMHSVPGGAVGKNTRTFGTTLDELEKLRDWLHEEGCTHVAMEATGVYWKPVHNVLEDSFTLLVGNAEHMHALRGRKTDVKDAEWIATLLRHGLIAASFIPDRAQRELRELTRFRTSIIRDRARVVNRLQKTLEGANIKLGAVLTDIVGASGQRILGALLRGDMDPEAMAELADPRILRTKRDDLERALLGRLEGRLAFLVRQQLQQIHMLDEQIAACDHQIAEEMAPFAEELARLDEIPGVGIRTAQVIVAEIGTDLSRFPSARELAAWAGICPANKASGGKRQRASTRKGNPWLRQALIEAGWAAGRKKNSHLGEQYRRLCARLGRKRAVVAMGHQLLVIIYFMLIRGTSYQDLGVEYLPARQKAEQRKRAIRRLQALGYEVHLTPVAA
jgi:transposase